MYVYMFVYTEDEYFIHKTSELLHEDIELIVVNSTYRQIHIYVQNRLKIFILYD